MEKKLIGGRLAVVGLLLLGVLAAPAWAAPGVPGGPPIAVSTCGTLIGNNSYYLTQDLVAPATAGSSCITFTGNGGSLDLNGHSIRGVVSINSFGIVSITSGNNVTIKGPGVVHDFGVCIALGRYALVQDVLVHDCLNGVGTVLATGILLGEGSKCVECRVHDVREGGVIGGTGIVLGDGCLLESSIVEFSDNGAQVGQDCKVWDLVVDSVTRKGLTVGAGTSVARSVISHFDDGPGLDYTACRATTTGYPTVLGCQDSSNSVWPALATSACSIADGSPGVPPNANCPTFTTSPGVFAPVITDCATNNRGIKYIPGAPVGQCVVAP
jgi:hypothetical protein